MVSIEEVDNDEESTKSREKENPLRMEIDLSCLSSSSSSSSSSASSSSSVSSSSCSSMASTSLKDSIYPLNNKEEKDAEFTQFKVNNEDGEIQQKKLDNNKTKNIHLNGELMKNELKKEPTKRSDLKSSDSKLETNTSLRHVSTGNNEPVSTDSKEATVFRAINPYKKRTSSTPFESKNNNKTPSEKIDYSVHKNEFSSVSGKTNSSSRQANINSSFYKPPPYVARPEPNVHTLTLKNRPFEFRTQTPINQFFQPPIIYFWKTKFKNFNHMQSEMASKLAFSDENVVVSAPTGA